MTDESKVKELRDEIESIDRELLLLIEQRLQKAREVAEERRKQGEPKRDYRQEKRVVSRSRRFAESRGVSPELAESVFLELIEAASTIEEQDLLRTSEAGNGQRVLVIGGAGKMGGWLTHFLDSQGFDVDIADLHNPNIGASFYSDWRDAPLGNYAFIAVATPLGVTNEILLELSEQELSAVIFDVGSLKSPVRQGLQALVDHGQKATSIHPMFGPETKLLSGRHVIFADLGCSEATDAVRQLFAPTTAVQVMMDLESHDHVIAYVLGLSHAVNIAFFSALAESGETAPRLAEMSSTTFDAQLEIARDVSEESPELYYEIQALNDYGMESLRALTSAVEYLKGVVEQEDQEAFIEVMKRGHAYLADIQPPR